MAFPGKNYAPPGVYTQTQFENPLAGAIARLKIPCIIGEGSQDLFQTNLEMVRGSSATVDQQVTQEDQTGRAVAAISETTGAVTFGAWDGARTTFQTRHYPLVSGNGSGTTTSDRSALACTINGNPVVVLSLDGSKGLVELAQAPKAGDVVRCTYFFNRTDTLTVDDVSSQVDPSQAVLHGQSGVVPGGMVSINNEEIGGNNTFVVRVGGISNGETTVLLPVGDKTMQQLANSITGGVAGLTASLYIDNFGREAIRLIAATDITVGSGTANGVLGFVPGESTGRNKVFHTFHGPIVDGSNGGITTTDPSAVTVKVNGTQVVPTAVDGSTRAVTLPEPPPAGAVVSITYYQNTWQDTFDYLANIGVTSVTRCGIVPDRSDYVDGADFVLRDDTIHWGTSTLVSSGVTTAGKSMFGDSQVSAKLVDNRKFLSPCTPTMDAGMVPPVTSLRTFKLSDVPTTGNGRNTPIGQSLFQSYKNDRIDLPTNRPDLIQAYWGYGLQDALDPNKAPVAVVSVDHEQATITLDQDVPPGATVYATFYYNVLQDAEFTLTVVNPAASGSGTYSVTSGSDASPVLNATLDRDSKSASLDAITLQFPSGSELNTDIHFGVSASPLFTGPVEEVVTVQFNDRDDTPAKYTVPSAGPFEFIDGESDHLFIRTDNNQNMGQAGIDLADPSGLSRGILAWLVGEEVTYSALSGGADFVVDSSNNEINLQVDGIPVSCLAREGTADLDAFVDAINQEALGIHIGVTDVSTTNAAAAGAGTIDFPLALNNASDVDDAYVGWQVIVATSAGSAATVGQIATVVAYDADGGANSTGQITTDTQWDQDITNTDEVVLINPDTRVMYASATKLTTAWTVAAGEFDEIEIAYVGLDSGPSSSGVLVVAPDTYNSPAELAGAIQDQLDAAACTTMNGGATQADFSLPQVDVTANADNQVVFTVRCDANDVQSGGGFFRFVSRESNGGADTDDLCVVLGIDADSNDDLGNSCMLGHWLIASKYTNPGSDSHDRLMLRNRIACGDGEMGADSAARMSHHWTLSQCGLSVASALGNSTMGLKDGQEGIATNRAVVKAASLASAVSQAGGQHDGSMVAEAASDINVVLFDGTGNSPANNVFDFSVDGTSWSVVLKGSADGIPTPLGSGAANADPATVIGQIEGAVGADPAFNTTDAPVDLQASVVGATTTINSTGHTFTNGQVVVIEGHSGLLDANGVALTAVNGVHVVSGVVAGTSFEIDLDSSGGTAGTGGEATLASGLAAVRASDMIRREGLGLRITSLSADVDSSVRIGTGSANNVLGFADGIGASRELVSAGEVASALMNNRAASAAEHWLGTWVMDAWAIGGDADLWFEEGLAATYVDASNNEYLYLQSNTAGTGSSVVIGNASADDALAQGTGFAPPVGITHAQGEDGVSGYTVTSNQGDGSGTANSSLLNNGIGQDGAVGQTYVDDVTGLTFTILEREGGSNYPNNNATFQINVSSTFTTDGAAPVRVIPGIEMLVTDTHDTATGDTAVVETFERGGEEPGIGDLYYTSYVFTKQDYTARLFTKVSTIEEVYGPVSPDNPVSLAAYLAILNGSVLVAVKQVKKAEGSNFGDLEGFRDAIDDLEMPMPGLTTPDVLVPLRGDSTEYFQYISKHCDVQSSIRNRQERTAMISVGAGTPPSDVGVLAQLLANTRMRITYPETATLTLTDSLGGSREYLVDGPYIAAAMAGNRCSPNLDVASPWTGAQLVGFNQLARQLDAVEQNQTAIKGVTVLFDRPPFLRVRHGLTTDMTNVLTKTPTIIQIADEVQRQSRDTLQQFIGIKFLPSIMTQVEGRLAIMMQGLVQSQIISAYTGISASVSPDDPTVAEVEAYYQPVFPLLYLVLTFHMRSSL